ncbi:MAG: manganese efflux pump MntP family protein [Actinomycetota bacterium]|nr:manganese efflux pump MntP family protein [Actinomycetota bacterium]
MSLLTLLLIALGVSADAFAVAIGKGLAMRRLDGREALSIAVAFGVFQAIMPLLGWLLGSQLAQYITAFDHWVAFALLAVVGGRMLREAVTPDDDDQVQRRLTWRELLVLALATSVDALAVGISFAFVDVDVLAAVTLIGAITLVVSLGGVLVGHRAGSRVRGPAEVLGGLLLIGIGVKIPLSHLGVL